MPNFVSQSELIPAHPWGGSGVGGVVMVSDTYVRGEGQMSMSSVYREVEIIMQW